jgi:hypothetical protein
MSEVSNLVGALRRGLDCGTDSEEQMVKEAADEIERLRIEVQHWKKTYDNQVERMRILMEFYRDYWEAK